MNKAKIITLIVSTAMMTSIQAQTPRDLDDLVDVRASSGERELEDRGYDQVKRLEVGQGLITYWWNSRHNECVAVNVKDGRYTAITAQPETMCDRSGGSSSGHHSSSHHSSRRDNPEDIEGMRASSAERELEDMGYEFVKSQKGSDRIWANWWNERHEDCITVVTRDGEIDSVKDSPEFDCEQHDNYSGSAHDGVTLYRDTNYRGKSVTLTRDESSLGDTRVGNDELSSIRIPRGCSVIIYKDTNFHGHSVELNHDQPELSRTSIGNDEASSIEVSCR